MYQPNLKPDENIVRTSPDVIVKNTVFDAFLTNRRIIFVKKTDEIYDRKELVFPLNLVKKFEPRADQNGTPLIDLSIQKPSGDVGEMIIRFSQKGDYRYAERDEWIEKLGILTPKNQSEYQRIPDFPKRPQDGQFSPSPQPSGYQRQSVPPMQHEMPPAQSRPRENRQGNDLFSPGPVREEQRAEPQIYREPNRPQTPPPVPPVRHERQEPPRPGVSSAGFCRFCGASIPPGSMFCPSCGQRVSAPPQFQESRTPQERPAQRMPTPPPRPPQHHGYNDYQQQSSRGGMSLEDDPYYRDMQAPAGRARHPGNGRRDMQKSEKARIKEEKRREKEAIKAQKQQQKAMKKASRGGYDSYGYKESRIPEGLPKILGIAAVIVVVLAVAGIILSSGMFAGGNSGTTPVAPPDSSSSTSTTNPGTTLPSGGTSTSDTFGTWHIEIFYQGSWEGSYTVNGVKTPISGIGYKPIPITNPTGTIVATVSKVVDTETQDAGGPGKIMMVDIVDPKGKKTTDSTSAALGTVTVTKTVS
ncbi:zinc ribbon domain-containing protein [Methanochimaera problematica]|nr:zinc-ribbon domain-containing protein [Methanoplanus sp. FWC-SCC4]